MRSLEDKEQGSSGTEEPGSNTTEPPRSSSLFLYNNDTIINEEMNLGEQNPEFPGDSPRSANSVLGHDAVETSRAGQVAGSGPWLPHVQPAGREGRIKEESMEERLTKELPIQTEDLQEWCPPQPPGNWLPDRYLHIPNGVREFQDQEVQATEFELPITSLRERFNGNSNCCYCCPS